MKKLPRTLVALVALAFAFGALFDTRRGGMLEKAIADAGAAITCAIVAHALEPEE